MGGEPVVVKDIDADKLKGCEYETREYIVSTIDEVAQVEKRPGKSKRRASR